MTIQWRKEFSVGNDALDGEHKKIIAMINTLEAAEGRNDEPRVVKTTLADLTDYVGRHFRAEEDAMQLCGYAMLEAHRKTHNDFANIVMGLNKRQSLPATELRALLNKWLTEHIMKIDQDYAASLAAWMAARKKK